jgi:hypothetical protein
LIEDFVERKCRITKNLAAVQKRIQFGIDWKGIDAQIINLKK